MLFISEESDDYIKALYELSENGISMRTLEKITGIQKSTLSYKFNKEVKINEWWKKSILGYLTKKLEK